MKYGTRPLAWLMSALLFFSLVACSSSSSDDAADPAATSANDPLLVGVWNVSTIEGMDYSWFLMRLSFDGQNYLMESDECTKEEGTYQTSGSSLTFTTTASSMDGDVCSKVGDVSSADYSVSDTTLTMLLDEQEFVYVKDASADPVPGVDDPTGDNGDPSGDTGTQKEWTEIQTASYSIEAFDATVFDSMIVTAKNVLFSEEVEVNGLNSSGTESLGSFTDGNDIGPIFLTTDSAGALYALSTHSSQLKDAGLFKYDGSDWTEVSTGFDDFAYGESGSSINLLSHDNPVVVFESSDSIIVKTWTGSAWNDTATIEATDSDYFLSLGQSFMDSMGNLYLYYSNNSKYLKKVSTTGTVSDVAIDDIASFNGSFAFDADDKLYFAYDDSEGFDDRRATVMVLEEGSWQVLGSQRFSDALSGSSRFNFAFDDQGNPYLAMVTSGTLLEYISVYYFDGSSWATTGDLDYINSSGEKFKIFILDGEPTLVNLEDGSIFAYKEAE